MENHLKRFLTKGEVIHHLNGDREDNRLENLLLCGSHAEHAKVHWNQIPKSKREKRMKIPQLEAQRTYDMRRKPKIKILCACGCGQSLITPDEYGRDRRYILNHFKRECIFGDGGKIIG